LIIISYNITNQNDKSYDGKQVSLETDLQRAADGGIAVVMPKPNGSLRIMAK